MDRLVDEMSQLGIAILTQQNMTNQSGTSKALDRIDSNSVLQVVSKSLQQCLQDAVNIAAEYAGVQPPEVIIPRDFDVDPLEGNDVTAINTLFTSGLVDQETALELLQHGEWLPDDVEVEEVLANTELADQQSMERELEKTEKMAEIGEGTPAKEEEG